MLVEDSKDAVEEAVENCRGGKDAVGVVAPLPVMLLEPLTSSLVTLILLWFGEGPVKQTPIMSQLKLHPLFNKVVYTRSN